MKHIPHWQRLMVYVDDPQQETALLQQAAALAKAWQAELHILMVMDQRELAHLAHASTKATAEVEQMAEAHLRKVLEPRLAALNYPCTFGLYCGRPFLEILRYVQEHEIDLVFKATSQQSSWQRGLFSSLDQHLLRKCPAAVWLEPLVQRRSSNTILASIDLPDATSSGSELLPDLNHHIRRAAAKLATTWQAVLHLVHAWDAPAADVIRYWVDDPQADNHAAAYARSCENSAEQALATMRTELEQEHAELDCRVLLRRGDARQVITEQTHMLNPRVLVMGTVGRSHLAGLLIGNTAEDVLNRLDCAVLAIKPKDFVCPISLSAASTEH